jgi:hypothetical protein
MRSSESPSRWLLVVFVLVGAGLGTVVGLIANALAVGIGVGAGVGLILGKLTQDRVLVP